MKTLSNAVIINGVSYTINVTEAKKVAQLLGITPNATISVPKTETKAEPKKSTPKVESEPKKRLIVGSLEQDGAHVRTVEKAYLSKNARYAIKMTALSYGAKKLGSGNAVYEGCKAKDKFVQVYEFPTVADADKFMADQLARMAK